MDKDPRPSRRDFLKNTAALGAAAAAGPILNREAQAQVLPLHVEKEKLPKGVQEVSIPLIRSWFTKDMEELDVSLVLIELGKKGIIKLPPIGAGQKKSEELLMSIVRWNQSQKKIEDIIMFWESLNFQDEFTPLRRDVIPVTKLKSLHVNTPAILKYLKDPRSGIDQ